jgi:hypothetical protein
MARRAPGAVTVAASRPAPGPRVALGALVALTLVAALAVPWRSALNVDNRTYADMIAGVARTGLPIIDNGPARQFPELQARWMTLRGDTLWGALPPVFAYLAAPFYALAGLRGVLALNVSLLGVLALGVARLTDRASSHPWAGVGAAWLTLAATTVWGSSLDASPYSLAITLTVWSTALAADSLDHAGAAARRYAFGAGLLGALAVGTHLLSAPMLLCLFAALALLPGDPAAFPTALRDWLRTQPHDAVARARLLAALLGAAGPLAAVGMLNRVRFGSFNPVTYGPCVWRSCAETGLDVQGIGAMLRWFAPLVAWAAGAAVAVWATRRHRPSCAAAALTAALVLCLPGTLRDRAGALARLVYAFVVDVSPLSLGFGFVRAPDGLGLFLGPFVVRSLLPAAPFVVLALAVPWDTARARRAAVTTLLPVVGLLGALALRANLPPAYALGYPFLSVRYVAPALPLLAAASAWALVRLGMSRRVLVASALLALACGLWFARADDDGSLLRRQLLLRVPLALAALVTVLVPGVLGAAGRAHRAALWVSVALALGLSAGAALGSDLAHLFALRREHELRLVRIARHLPHRVAVYGYPVELDPVVSLREGRDLRFADLYETRDWAFEPLVRRWWAEGRTVFAVHRGGDTVTSPWPSVRYEAVDVSLGLWRVLPR